MKKTALASALAIGLGFGTQAALAAPLTGEFCMYDATGDFISSIGWVGGTDSDMDGLIDCDVQVSGTIDNNTFALMSPQKFFNQPWTAHDGVILAPGPHQIDSIQAGTYDFTVGAGQVGGHILFDWGAPAGTPCGQANCDIDVVMAWDVNCVFTATNEECTYASTDVAAVSPPGQPDGILGLEMIDGAFVGSAANFNFTALFPLPGAPTFTPPADPAFLAPEQATPAIIDVDLGTVTDEAPTGTTVDYSTDGKPVLDPTKTWIPDDNATNTITVNATQTVNSYTVDWRATNPASQMSFMTQNVTVTVADATPPVLTSTPADVNTNVTSTSDSVCFGALSAADAIEPNLTVEWSHDGFNFNPANPDTGNPCDNSSTGFGPNANTVQWRVSDASGNMVNYTQNVFLNLPAGITGKACTIDLTSPGTRLTEGRFTMRDQGGALVGSVDNTITGDIDTTLLCSDVNCSNQPPGFTSAARLVTTQPFFGFTWLATPVRLFGPGTYQFETCPFPRTFNAASGFWESPDGSNRCGGEFTPNLLEMTVGPGQLGAHMLFEWSVNKSIDVAVVWDVDCNKFQLTSSDPDGDGVLASRMVDGPFKGNNAAFDVSTQPGEPPIADGGYTATIAVAENTVSGESPIPLTLDPLPAFNPDPAAVTSCVGGCAKFTTTDLLDGMDAGGAYQYAQAVLPLTTTTPFWSLYRLYDEGTGTWGPFRIDNRNNVRTAPLEAVSGECPEPGNGDYDRPITGSLADKLRAGDWCVQLTIEDGGPNDADGMANGSVSDPGGVAEVPAVGLPATQTSGGGCSIAGHRTTAADAGHWWLLAGLLGWLGLKRRKTA